MKIKTVIFTIGIIIAFGCERFPVGNEFLEKAPGVDVTKDSIFTRLEYAERFLWGAYTTLPYGVTNSRWTQMSHDMIESLTDLNHGTISWGGPVATYYSGNYTAATENGSNHVKYHLTRYRAMDGIRRAYIFIDNIDKVPGIGAGYARQLKAEARMIQAHHWTQIFRHYGGAPWLSRAFDVNDDFEEIPRITAQATADSIVALIDKAIPDLPWAIADKENWSGRYTRAGAMGLKARVLLFNASPLFNDSAPYREGEASDLHLVWHGGYDANRWKLAADAAQALITEVESTGEYNILSTGNLRQDFQNAYYRRWSPEALISTRIDRFRTNWASWVYSFYWASWDWGSTQPTHTYVDMFHMANGLPITDPASGYDPNDPYANRDPRLYETVLVNGDDFRNRQAELWIGGRERRNPGGNQARFGYILRKFMLDRDGATSYLSISHWPYLRLPEIYLSYAEAINEFNGGPTPEAYRCVNVVRNRVGLGDLTPGLSQEEFREAVILERALEFGNEEVRWFDLVRWKRENDFTKQLWGMNVQSDDEGVTFTYELEPIPKIHWQNDWDPKWYLSAFPVNEINKGYGLVQNPGWE